MVKRSEIQDRLWALNDDRISLDDFERWISSAAVNMHKDSAPDARDQASDILFMFSDYGEGHIDADQLRRQLLALLDNVVVCLRLDLNLSLSRVHPAILSANSAPFQPVELRV